jgi:hypothetical protein
MYMLKKHRKNVLQLKSIEKNSEAWSSSKINARGESQSKECLEKNKNIPRTCISRSSCMTSFFLDPVFGSTTSCGTNESLLSYPKLHKWGKKYHLSDRGNHPRNLVFLCKIFKNSEIGSRKEEEWEMQSQNLFYFSTFETRLTATSPTGKVRPSFSRTNLFKFATRAWSLCAGTCRAITSCNSWSAEAEFRLCPRTSKGPIVGVCWRSLSPYFRP